jgi:hypothetical protein
MIPEARRRVLFGTLAGLLALAAAPARPTFPPTRDVAVQYHAVISDKTAPHAFLLRYRAEDARARLDGDLPGYVLVDLRPPRAQIVMPKLQLVFDLPADAGLDQVLTLGNRAQFARAGTETIAGLSCTRWRISGPQASGTACVTADGVVLRAEGRDRDGRSGSVEAVAVRYGPEPATLFTLPPGLHAVRLAHGGSR